MTTYKIQNTLSGADLGTYDADSEMGALEAMAKAAGYSSYSEACEVAPSKEGEIEVTEIPTLYVSLSMSNANTVARCVELIAEAPIVEGMEGIEFTAEQLAGQWAADYAIDADIELSDIDSDTLEAYVQIVSDHCQEESGVTFDQDEALSHGLAVIKAKIDESNSF